MPPEPLELGGRAEGATRDDSGEDPGEDSGEGELVAREGGGDEKGPPGGEKAEGEISAEYSSVATTGAAELVANEGGGNDKDTVEEDEPVAVDAPPSPVAVPFAGQNGSGACTDIDNDVSDSFGAGCAEYDANIQWCEYYDDVDFTSADMCCACGGGEQDIDNADGDTGEGPSQRSVSAKAKARRAKDNKTIAKARRARDNKTIAKARRAKDNETMVS